MKIILGNEEIIKIIKNYAYSEFPAKEPDVVITNKRNGVEISINLTDKKEAKFIGRKTLANLYRKKKIIHNFNHIL